MHCVYNVKTGLHVTLVYLFDLYLFVGLAEITSFKPYTMSGKSLPKNAYFAKNTTVILRCQVVESADVSKISIRGRGSARNQDDIVSDL